MSKVVLAILSLSIAALLFDAIALEASTVPSATVEVPFAFHIQSRHKVLPAGEYRIERTMDSPLTRLINTRTGERVMFLNPAASPKSDKAQFESAAKGMALKAIG